MAKADNIKVAVEKAVHSAFADLAQNIADKHGIKVNAVHFDWLEMSTPGSTNMLVVGTSADTTTKV